MITTTEHRISTNKLLMDILEFDKALFDNSTLSDDEIKYFDSIIEGFNNQTQFYIDWLDSDEARRIFYENEEYNEHTFGKIEEQIKEIANDTSLTADEIITRIYDSGLQAGADEIKRTKYYNDATKYGLSFLQNYNFELISNINTDLANHIRAEIFTGIAAGEGMPEVAQRILAATDNSLTGKTLSAKQRAMMIARTETARAMTQGRLQSYANYGVREVKILTAGDERVCAICREAETKIFKIEEAGNLVPFHPMCYMPDTEVFTDNGWKHFQDLTTNDKILSMNPETGITEFLKPNKLIAHENTYGYMYHIHNKWFDTCVTPDHDCFIHQRKGQKKVFVPEFRKPSELNSESYFLRTVENNNISPDTVDVNGLKFDASDYAFFMAWYLSEGSVLHNPETAKARSYPIKISQQIIENREIIQPIFEKITKYLGIKLYVGKDYFEFHSKELYDYLKPLGYCHEMYIPKELFDLSRNDLNIFLENYILGDGHSRIQSNKLVSNSHEKCIVTSSLNLVNDLSHVILLAGFYPSISLVSEKGTISKHHNGVYAQNHDVYCLRVNRSKHARVSGCSVDKIDYDGMVYCVELPKYHTLWTKRNGKTSWNGNCRCSVMAYIRHVLGSNPIEDAQIINLTPLSSNFLGGSNSNTNYKLPTNISEKRIQTKLKDVVDSKDLKDVSNQLFNLIKMIEKPSIEYGTSMTNNRDVVKLIQTTARRVDLSSKLKDEALKKGILTLMHSHPEGESPLGSDDDLLSYALYRAKYGLSFNGFGIFFVRNTKPNLNKKRHEDISESIADIAEGMEEDFLSENPDAKRLLEEDKTKYYGDLHDFVNSNHDKYFNEYEDILKKYGINVTFINWK